MRKPNYHLPREAPVYSAPLKCLGSDLAPAPALIDGCYGVKVSDGWYGGAEHFHIVGFPGTETEVRPPAEKSYNMRGFILASAFALGVIGSVISTLAPAAFAAGPVPSHPTAQVKPAAPEETDGWYTKAGHSIVARSDTPFKLTFDACRENEKHHVSCQYTDSEGSAHWVYLPGVKIPTPKK
jgi:hypothetical protein